MTLSVADQIWNRAAMKRGGASPRAGDAALTGLLQLHGMIMNGGVSHALQALSASEFANAVHGFRYFGLSGAAQLLESALATGDTGVERIGNEYARLVPNDEVLVAAFEATYKRLPGAFSPLP